MADGDVPPGGASVRHLAQQDFSRRRRRELLRRAKPWILGLVFVIACGAGAWVFFASDLLQAEKVKVSFSEEVMQRWPLDTEPVSISRVESRAAVDIGTPLARISLSEIEERVAELAPVLEVTASRAWPHTISIEITPRIPLAVVDLGKGLRSFDEEGVVFGSYDQAPSGLAMVRGDVATRREALAEAARVLTSLPASLQKKVRFLQVTSVDNIQLKLRDGRLIMWGSATQSARKAKVVRVLLDKEGSEFDVSVPTQPTIK